MQTNILGPKDAPYVNTLTDLGELTNKEKAILLACVQEYYEECIHRMALALSEPHGEDELAFLACIITQFYHKAELEIPDHLLKIANMEIEIIEETTNVVVLYLLQIDRGFKSLPIQGITDSISEISAQKTAELTKGKENLNSVDLDHIKLAILANELTNHASFRMALRVYKLADETKSKVQFIDNHKRNQAKMFSETYTVGNSIYNHNKRLPENDNEILNQLYKVIPLHHLEFKQREKKEQQEREKREAEKEIQDKIKRAEASKKAQEAKAPDASVRGTTLTLSNFSTADFEMELSGLDIAQITSLVISNATLDDGKIPDPFIKQYAHIDYLTIRSAAIKDLSSLVYIENLKGILISQDMFDKEEIILDLSPLNKFTKMTSLDLSSCTVSHLDLLLPKLPLLKQISFGGLRNFKIPTEVWKLPNLEVFGCSGCKLDEIVVEDTHKDSKIRLLRLNSNQLTSFPTILLSLPRLDELWLGGNKLSHIADDLKLATELCVLRIKNNAFDEAEKEKILALDINVLKV